MAPRLRTLTRDSRSTLMLRSTLDELGIRNGERFVVAHPDVLTLDMEPGKARNTDPDTSHIAAQLNAPRAGSDKAKTLAYVVSQGKRGATADEVVVSLGTGNAWRRLSDLKSGGWVQNSGRRRQTRTGAPAEVFVASEKAIASQGAAHEITSTRSRISSRRGSARRLRDGRGMV